LVTGLLEAVGFVRTFVPIALGLTTTALGTLLPILRDGGMLTGRLAPYILSAGAVGEFLPVRIDAKKHTIAFDVWHFSGYLVSSGRSVGGSWGGAL